MLGDPLEPVLDRLLRPLSLLLVATTLALIAGALDSCVEYV